MNQLLQFHENPAVIKWWATRLERMLNWFTPAKRRLILVMGAIYVGIKEPLNIMKNPKLDVPADMLGKTSVILALLVLIWLIYKAAAKFAALPAVIRRHPQLALHAVLWVMFAVLALTSSVTGWWHSVFVGTAITFPFLVWRCGYLLQAGQCGRVLHTSLKDHLFYLWPVYGGSETPYGKGHDYLSRCEAKNNEDLARSQLSGINLLLLLSLVWHVTSQLMNGSFYGDNSFLVAHGSGIPDLATLVMMGSKANVGQSWASIYCEFISQVLEHAAEGHRIIGILRLFGFNVFRNTYKPLYSESIVEFWNRYYYYFKELMANFFFIPMFMQTGNLFKKWPKVRLFCAVFAAAFVGNMYYHILKRINLLADGQVGEAVYSLRSRFFYCFVLALGIFVSMWRAQQRNNRPLSNTAWARGLRMFGVWTFFSLIFIWNVRVKQGGDFYTRVAFFLNLFGLS